MSYVLYGVGDARDHATFTRLRRECADVRYALLDGRNALLAREPGVHEVDGPDGVLKLATGNRCTIVVQRPELLLEGSIDVFQRSGALTIGPNRAAAELEGSKLFCKQLLREHGIPTPPWHEAACADEAKTILREHWAEGSAEWVVKADRYISDASLRTFVPRSLSEAIEAVERLSEVPGELRGERLLLERRVSGPEVSLHALLDGVAVHVCPLASDYKRLYAGDRGPNTHGMGAVASTSRNAESWHAAFAPLVERVAEMIAGAGIAYRGVIYVGVVKTPEGPTVLECNVRPGNPEWQALLALLDTPLSDVFASLANSTLEHSPRWIPSELSASLFAAVPGYPVTDSDCDAEIRGLGSVPEDIEILGEGVAGGPPLRAGSGRSLCLVARARNATQLRERIYGGMEHVHFDGMQVRDDIGRARNLVTADREALPSDHATFVAEAACAADRAEALRRVQAVTEDLLASTGRGLELDEAQLQNLDLSGFDLRRCTLSRAQLHGAKLAGADLSEAALICPGLERTSFAGACLRGAYLHALGAQVCDFRDADMRELVDSTGALFHGCHFERADLRNAMLAGSSFYQTALDGALLDGANLQACQIVESSCAKASLARALLDEVVLTRVDLRECDLQGASGRNLVIQAPTAAAGLDLRAANLPGLRLVGLRVDDLRAAGLRAADADVRDCHLPRVDLRHADIARSSWTRVVAPGARLTGASAEASRWLHCVLDGADLCAVKAENLTLIDSSAVGASLIAFQGRCAHLRNCDLSHADLTGAYLYRAMLTGDPPTSMKLTGASMSSAVIVQAYIAADLAGADLRNVRGAYSRLNQTVLSDADLSGAQLFEASMIKCDLRRAQLRGVAPPLLADRCPGLSEALAAAGESSCSAALQSQVVELERSLRRAGRLST